MQEDTPIQYRREDFEPANQGMNPAGAGVDLGGLGDLEPYMKAFERFVPLLETAAKTIMLMRRFEAGGNVNDQDDQDLTAGVPVQNSTGSPAVDGKTKGSITSLKIYQSVLRQMNQLPKEMTVETLLEHARDNKQMVLAGIEEEITAMFKDSS